MGVLDKNLRQQAIPYYGQIMGYNHSENSEYNISQTYQTFNGANASLIGIGDLQPLIAGGTSQNDYMIRILRPKFGQIIQAFLNISLTFAVTETSPKFNVSCGGSFQADGITANVPSSTFIAQCMQSLNAGTPFTGTAGRPLTLYKINIQPLIPQVGAANYVQDCYSLGIHFITPPVLSGLYALTKFFVTGSVMVT